MKPEMWTTTRDTRIAAAMGSMGVPLRLKKTVDSGAGELRTLFFMGLRSVDGRVDTKRLQGQLNNGSLERNDPAHELLTILRAFENRNAVLDFQNKGKFIELQKVPGTEIWQYVPSDRGLPGMAGLRDAIETTDLKMVAALGLVGIPLVAITGSGRDHKYYLPVRGPRRADGQPPADGLKLRAAWQANREAMTPDDPFVQGAWGLWNRERLVAALGAEVSSILLRKPRSVKAALIREDAADAAFDRAKEHFDQ